MYVGRCLRTVPQWICAFLTTFLLLNVKPENTYLDSYDCNETAAQRWLIRKGPTNVQVYGTGYCLDGGSSEYFGPDEFAYYLFCE